MSHRFRSNRPLSVQNKQRPRQIIPIGRHCRRTEVDMQETRAGPGREAARQRQSAPPLANKQYCCKKKKKGTKERLWQPTGACWKWMQGGNEWLPEQDTFVAETEVEIRVCVWKKDFSSRMWALQLCACCVWSRAKKTAAGDSLGRKT